MKSRGKGLIVVVQRLAKDPYAPWMGLLTTRVVARRPTPTASATLPNDTRRKLWRRIISALSAPLRELYHGTDALIAAGRGLSQERQREDEPAVEHEAPLVHAQYLLGRRGE